MNCTKKSVLVEVVYHLITLFFRKTTHDTEEGRSYETHKRPADKAAACSYALLNMWIPTLEDILCMRKLLPNDLIFPKLRPSDGRVYLGVMMKHADYSEILNFWVKEAQVNIIFNGERGKCTLHCFRRGGA